MNQVHIFATDFFYSTSIGLSKNLQSYSDFWQNSNNIAFYFWFQKSILFFTPFHFKQYSKYLHCQKKPVIAKS